MKNLIKLLNQLELAEPEAVAERFKTFYRMLTRANAEFNLTSVMGSEETEQKHFIDSLSAYEHIKENMRVLDIGAGAGFPSIPLALCKSKAQFMLIDGTGKKIEFLKKVKDALELTNVTVLKIRIEDLLKNPRYDYVVARGVAELRTLCEYALPFLKVGGRLLAYKAQKAEEEIKAAQNALKVLSGTVEKIVPYQLTVNNETFERNLLFIKKLKEADPKYPRGGNKPRLDPL